MSPVILSAFPAAALDTIERVLQGRATIVAVTSLDAAEQALRERHDITLVLCGVHFDGSRMYDLLRFVRRAYPGMRFISCRILNRELPGVAREAIEIAALALGATQYLDLPRLADEFGAEEADKRLRDQVLGC
jgi:CheY-like chemotaxis protein